MAKEVFNRKTPLLTSKLSIGLRKKLEVLRFEHYIVWLRDLDPNKIGTKLLVEFRNVVLEKNGEDEII
jgi:hypothetical protein